MKYGVLCGRKGSGRRSAGRLKGGVEGVFNVVKLMLIAHKQNADDIEADLKVEVVFFQVLVCGFDEEFLLAAADKFLGFSEKCRFSGFYFDNDQLVIFLGNDVYLPVS